LNLEKKKKIVADLKEKFNKVKVLIVTDYKGLDVKSVSELRKKIREAGAEYHVVKNSLLIRASDETDIAPLKESFKGPSAVAFSFDDPVAPARVLTDFAKENKKLEIKKGIIDGKILDLKAVKALASLPSKDILLGQVLSTMNAVPTSLVRALNDIPVRMLNILQAIKDQKEAA